MMESTTCLPCREVAEAPAMTIRRRHAGISWSARRLGTPPGAGRSVPHPSRRPWSTHEACSRPPWRRMPTGVLGLATFTELTRPLQSARVRQIERTMERLRWLPSELVKRPHHRQQFRNSAVRIRVRPWIREAYNTSDGLIRGSLRQTHTRVRRYMSLSYVSALLEVPLTSR